MQRSKQTLYDRIGGEPAIERLVDRFYQRVLGDPELATFFRGTSMDRLRLMQREFFSAALDGPVRYTGTPLSHAHQGRGIRRNHFARFVEHLLATLEDCSLSQREVLDVIERVDTYVDEVIGSVGPAG